MAKRIIVLGSTGMLGHIIYEYLNSITNYEVIPLKKDELNALDSESKIESILKKYHPNFIINSIGLINKYANKEGMEEISKKINTDFPHLLAYLSIKNNWKLIHISTDCYMDKDTYGLTKYYGEINDKTNLTIRTSIIGPELKNGFGLFHWFMTQDKDVCGYTKAYWDGVTTLEMAKFIQKKMESFETGIVDYRTRNSISKYELLNIISKIFGKKISIIKDEREMKDKRESNPAYWCDKSYLEQISELKNFMIENSERYKDYLN